MDADSLLSLLQQRLSSNPEYDAIARRIKSDAQTDLGDQQSIINSLSKYDKENKLVSTVQKAIVSLGHTNINKASADILVRMISSDPNMVYVLHQFLNHPFPLNLRTGLMKCVLGKKEVGEDYLDATKNKPYSTASPQEQLIREKCSQYIKKIVGFDSTSLIHTASGVQLMFKSLSYWHIHEGRPLTDLDYQLALLLASLYGKECDSVTIATVVSLLAGFAQLKDRLKATDRNTVNIAMQYLQQVDPQLSEHIMKVRADADTSESSSLLQIILPLHNTYFVGYLNQEVVWFFLDQCAMSSDVPSFNPFFAFTSTLLALLSHTLTRCSNVSSILSHLERAGPTLTVAQVQAHIQDHYIDALAASLNVSPIRVSRNVAHTDDSRLLEEISNLKKRLSDEKRERSEKQIAHRNEIAHYKTENDELRRQLKLLSPSTVVPETTIPEQSTVSLPATPDDGDISGPLVAPLRQRQVEALWLDINKNVMQRVKRLAFNNPLRKTEMDKLTYDLNKQYAVLRSRAEKQLYGEEVTVDEWEQLTDEEYYEKIYRIDSVVDTLYREILEDDSKKKDKGKKK